MKELSHASGILPNNIYYLVRSCYNVSSAGLVLRKMPKGRPVLAISAIQAMDISDYILKKSKKSPRYQAIAGQWAGAMEYIGKEEQRKIDEERDLMRIWDEPTIKPAQTSNIFYTEIEFKEKMDSMQLMIDAKNQKIERLTSRLDNAMGLLDDHYKNASRDTRGLWARIRNK